MLRPVLSLSSAERRRVGSVPTPAVVGPHFSLPASHSMPTIRQRTAKGAATEALSETGSRQSPPLPPLAPRPPSAAVERHAAAADTALEYPVGSQLASALSAEKMQALNEDVDGGVEGPATAVAAPIKLAPAGAMGSDPH